MAVRAVRIRIDDNQEAVQALSWEQVNHIANRFSSLNPYDRQAVPGSILKIESDNFDPETGHQRQLYCFAISAKRYALFVRQADGTPVLLQEGINNQEDRWSEHGLGHLLNPTDIDSDDRKWIAQSWLNIIQKALGLPSQELNFANLPAVGQTTVSSAAVMHPFESLNEGKNYADQIKPFNFLLTCHIKKLGHPPGVDPKRFHLIAPYERDSKKLHKINWIDQYTGNRYRITTEGPHGSRRIARVKTYAETLSEYEFHPEAKCADAEGSQCTKQTIGLLQRRDIRIEEIKNIGKESNSIEEVEAGLVHAAENVYTEYPDPRRDEWATKILPALRKLPLPVPIIQREIRLSRSAIYEILSGRSRPHPKNQKLLAAMVREMGLI